MSRNIYDLRNKAKKAKENQILKFATFSVTKQQTIDKVTIAMHKIGIDKEGMRKFFYEFCDVDEKYANVIITDGNDDDDLDYSDEDIDRDIRECVPEDMFVPHKERYDFDDNLKFFIEKRYESEWVTVKNAIVCPMCEYRFEKDRNDTLWFNFCPNCGADMRGENK